MGKAPNYSSSVEELSKQYKDASNLSARQRIYRFAKEGGTPWPRWVLDQFELPSDARVLELGCGNGVLWKNNADRIPAGWKIVLTDASAGMLDEARLALKDAPSQFEFRQLDVESAPFPFPDSSFDGVVANHMLYHVVNRDRAIGEVHRMLRAGETCYAATNGDRHLRELKDLIDAFVPLPPGAVWTNDGPFQLENGEGQLRRHFGTVEVRRVSGELMVTDVRAIIDYALSIEWAKDVLVGEPLARFREEVEKRIRNDGRIRVGTEAGLFCSRK